MKMSAVVALLAVLAVTEFWFGRVTAGGDTATLGDHFDSAAQHALVTFVEEGGQTNYVPKGSESRLGPVVTAERFVMTHFGNQRIDVHHQFDPGTDDFPAAILLMAREDRFRPMSFTAGFGNVHPSVTLENARLCVALARRFDLPVYRGNPFPLDGKRPKDAAGFHGEDGLAGARPFNFKEVKEAMKQVVVMEDGSSIVARDVLKRHREGGAPVLLLSTGALTDLFQVLDLVVKDDPRALGKVRISIMGGGLALNFWHTNASPWAEFNVFQDPKAAQRAFEIMGMYRIPTVVIPLDLTHQTSVSALVEGYSLEKLAARDKNPVADMVAQLFGHVSSFDRERSMGRYGFSWRRRFMHDPNAVSVLVVPNLYKGFTARVAVTGRGDEGGRMTVTPDPEANVFVAVGGNPEAIVRHWLDSFSAYRGKN